MQRAGGKGVQEIVIGMAHRGRLNVLVNTLGKMPKDLFAEFEGKRAESLPSGDVKYHQGFSSDITTPGGPVHLTLAFNPSHLEIVNPVVEGSVQARASDRRGDAEGDQVLPVLVHGDAAFAGQGVVMETLDLAQTRGYYTGGTVHIVVNNQIGFTTSDPRDARSTLYCTDVVKMIEAPMFHVNGDDPEAVVLVHRRSRSTTGMQFNKDVVVDIVCFRRLGHNEQDEPMVTQPLMYKKIAQHPGHAQALRATSSSRRACIAEPTARRDGRRRSARRWTRGKHTNKTRCSPTTSASSRSTGRRSSARKWTDARRHRAAARRAEAAGRAHHHRARRTSSCIRASRRSSPTARAMGRGELPLDWGMGEHLAYRVAARERLRGAPVGRGQRPRHVHPPPRGAARPEPRALGRGHLHAAAARRRRARRRSSSSTRCCPKRRCSASSTATRPPSRTRS